MSWKPPQHFNAPQQTVTYQQPPPQKLHNGNLGPNFNYSKPTNLSNSAVLRMLQEQEDDVRVCGTIKKEVIWPPPQDELEEDVNSDPYFNSQNGHPYENFHQKPQKRFEPPPPTVIRLRESPPISQHTAPVFKSQPAADTIRGGFRMRGDQKWPPPEYKAQAEAENQARVELARGPAFRPLKVKKDYSTFFAKNALPNTYPGYKIPPGTQHYSKPPVTQY